MIWCVEDDPSIRDIVVYALNSTGLETCGFESGTAFWEALQEKQPDLVLLDVMLPGVDGVELLTRMKASEKFREIPVIMATAKGTEYDKVQSLDLGTDDYLVKPFGMMEIAEEVKASLDPLAQQQNITISVSGEHCQILAVPGLIREIAQNLCSNAVKYNVPGGSVQMNVRYEKGRVALRVKDTGIGIPREYQSRVFERFFRVDKSHSKQSGGTGLGLSIVKHAAQYHHAQIDLQSTPGEGSTITILF